jgi:hypothetical protein
MDLICQSCEINKSLKSSDCAPLDCTQQCTVCMECIPDKNQSKRTCGHMMCAVCDVTWRSRSFIVEKKCQKWNNEGKEEIFSVYMIESECPSCRGKEPASAYMSRSKVSLVHEIQCLLATLYANRIRKLTGYNVVDIDHMDSTVPPIPVPRTPVRPSVAVQRRLGVTEPVQILQMGGREWTFIEPAPRAPIRRRALVTPQVGDAYNPNVPVFPVPVPVPAPVPVVAPVVAPVPVADVPIAPVPAPVPAPVVADQFVPFAPVPAPVVADQFVPFAPAPAPVAVAAPFHFAVDQAADVIDLAQDQAPAPVVNRAPPQFIDGVRVRAGTCIRKYRNLGCTTARTNLRCVMCNVVLCRQCYNQCPCRGT